MTHDGRVAASEIDELLADFRKKHYELHRQWTAAVGTPGYVKATWRDRENAQCAEYRDRATALGYPRTAPLLPGGAK